MTCAVGSFIYSPVKGHSSNSGTGRTGTKSHNPDNGPRFQCVRGRLRRLRLRRRCSERAGWGTGTEVHPALGRDRWPSYPGLNPGRYSLERWWMPACSHVWRSYVGPAEQETLIRALGRGRTGVAYRVRARCGQQLPFGAVSASLCLGSGSVLRGTTPSSLSSSTGTDPAGTSSMARMPRPQLVRGSMPVSFGHLGSRVAVTHKETLTGHGNGSAGNAWRVEPLVRATGSFGVSTARLPTSGALGSS